MSRRVLAIGGLFAGYVGVYLCRKNLSVAIPLLQSQLKLDPGQVGWITTIATLAYAMGKLSLGLVVDKIGGRRGFLAALVAVALIGALSALAPGLVFLTIVYSVSRFFGAAGWPAMMKLVPTWYGPKRTGTVVAVLSLAYVLGGILATLLAGEVVHLGFGWRAVMAFPSLVVVVIAVSCALVVRAGPLVPPALEKTEKVAGATWLLLRTPRFLIVCGLSFALTLMRETFNVWSVDYLNKLGARSPKLRSSRRPSTSPAAGASSSWGWSGIACRRARTAG